MPKVSVIIPNYNHEHYLKHRIDSVLNQTFQDFEVIILDDKSTDNSKTIIEEYRAHPKVSKIIYNEVNSGTTFKQWNKGIKLAEGDLIWLAESDDDASNFFLEELIAKFDKNPALGIVYCDSYYMNEKSEKLQCTHIWKNERFSTNRWNNDYENSGINEVNNYLFFHNIIDNASSALLKKEILFKAGLADESLKYVGDMYLYTKMLLLSDVAYVAKPLNYFRDHAVNTSKQSFANGLKYFELILIYNRLTLNNDCIDKETKRKKLQQALQDYKFFVSTHIERKKGFSSLISGHYKLLKSNWAGTIKLLASVVIAIFNKTTKSIIRKITISNY